MARVGPPGVGRLTRARRMRRRAKVGDDDIDAVVWSAVAYRDGSPAFVEERRPRFSHRINSPYDAVVGHRHRASGVREPLTSSTRTESESKPETVTRRAVRLSLGDAGAGVQRPTVPCCNRDDYRRAPGEENSRRKRPDAKGRAGVAFVSKSRVDGCTPRGI